MGNKNREVTEKDLRPFDPRVFEVMVYLKDGDTLTFESFGYAHMGKDRDPIKESSTEGVFFQIPRDSIKYIVCTPTTRTWRDTQ